MRKASSWAFFADFESTASWSDNKFVYVLPKLSKPAADKSIGGAGLCSILDIKLLYLVSSDGSINIS